MKMKTATRLNSYTHEQQDFFIVLAGVGGQFFCPQVLQLGCLFVFAQRSTDERGTGFPRLRRLLSHAARGEEEAASANTANSFILMTLLTSAEQRSGSDGSYHSRGWEKGYSSPLPLSTLWQPPPPPPLGCIPKL